MTCRCSSRTFSSAIWTRAAPPSGMICRQIFLREHPRKEGEGMTLESVVTRMGIPMERPFHDALSDTPLHRRCLPQA